MNEPSVEENLADLGGELDTVDGGERRCDLLVIAQAHQARGSRSERVERLLDMPPEQFGAAADLAVLVLAGGGDVMHDRAVLLGRPAEQVPERRSAQLQPGGLGAG